MRFRGLVLVVAAACVAAIAAPSLANVLPPLGKGQDLRGEWYGESNGDEVAYLSVRQGGSGEIRVQWDPGAAARSYKIVRMKPVGAAFEPTFDGPNADIKHLFLSLRSGEVTMVLTPAGPWEKRTFRMRRVSYLMARLCSVVPSNPSNFCASPQKMGKRP